jgi:hypothetical protein
LGSAVRFHSTDKGKFVPPSNGVALDEESLHLNAALAEVAGRGNLDRFPANEEEKLALMMTVKRLGLVSWSPVRSRYELTDLGRQRLGRSWIERASTPPSIGRSSRLLIGGATGLLAGAACMMFIPALFTSAPQQPAVTAPASVQHAKPPPAPAPSRVSVPPPEQSSGERTAAPVTHVRRHEPERQLLAAEPGSAGAPTVAVQPGPAAPKPSAPVSLTEPPPANSKSELAGGTAGSPASTHSPSQPQSSSSMEDVQQPSREVVTKPIRHAATSPKHPSAHPPDSHAEAAARKNRRMSKSAGVGHASTRHSTESARRHTREDTRETWSLDRTRSARRDADEESRDGWSSGKTRNVERIGPLMREERELGDGTIVRMYRYGNGPAYYVTRRNRHFPSGPRAFARVGPPWLRVPGFHSD